MVVFQTKLSTTSALAVDKVMAGERDASLKRIVRHRLAGLKLFDLMTRRLGEGACVAWESGVARSRGLMKSATCEVS